MSLINEALKKAQRQRTEDPVVVVQPAPGTVNAPVVRIAKRKDPMAARTLVLLVGGGIALLLMCGVVTFLYLGSETTPPAAPAPVAPVAVVPAPPPIAPLPAPPVAIKPVDPVVTVALPTVTPPVPAATVATPAPAVTPVPVAAAPVTPPKPLALVPTANPKVYQFLETLRISGIRVSDTDPKVIMNDRVFRLNDLVDRPTQLRLIRVDTASLTFADATGYEYQKNF